jgi:D-beta-D-heptose 7-phosphate kinase/D-beta-D-heptose 1-phosphate adenosyltransferase
MDKKIFMTGTFDVIHRGHIDILEYAKSLGDELFVAIDSDERVKLKKGKSRPFNNWNDRAKIIRSIRHVDKILKFDNDDELLFILKTIQPDIWVIGSDWKGYEIPGERYVSEIKYFDRIEGYSTTGILEGKISG